MRQGKPRFSSLCHSRATARATARARRTHAHTRARALPYLADAAAQVFRKAPLRQKPVQVHDAAAQLLRVVVEVGHETLDRADDNGNEEDVDKAQANDKGALGKRGGGDRMKNIPSHGPSKRR